MQPVLASAKSPKLGSTVANQGLFEPGACEHGNRIYYALGNRLCSVKKDGTDERELCTISEGRILHHLTVLDNAIYGSIGMSPMIHRGMLVRMKPDGTGYKIYKGDEYDNCENLCAANGKLYYGKQGEKHWTAPGEKY